MRSTRPFMTIMLLLTGGCTQKAGGLDIVSVPIAVVGSSGGATTCTFPSSTTAAGSSFGFYDPQIAPTYGLALVVSNTMPAPATQTPALVYGREIRNQTGAVTVLGVESCWFLAPSGVGQQDAVDDGFINCDSLPADQRGFSFASGTIPTGSGVVVSDVLPAAALQARGILGADFDPATSSIEADIVIQSRVVGSMQGGTVVKSGWFVFPIHICSGCLSATCALPGACTTPPCCPSAACQLGNSPSFNCVTC